MAGGLTVQVWNVKELLARTKEVVMHFPDHPLLFVGMLIGLLLYIALTFAIGGLITNFNRRK